MATQYSFMMHPAILCWNLTFSCLYRMLDCSLKPNDRHFHVPGTSKYICTQKPTACVTSSAGAGAAIVAVTKYLALFIRY